MNNRVVLEEKDSLLVVSNRFKVTSLTVEVIAFGVLDQPQFVVELLFIQVDLERVLLLPARQIEFLELAIGAGQIVDLDGISR